MDKQSVLVVDDEPDIRELLEITLLRMGLDVSCAENYTAATRLLHARSFDFCLTDMKLPDGDGITLVKYIQKHQPDMPFLGRGKHAGAGNHLAVDPDLAFVRVQQTDHVLQAHRLAGAAAACDQNGRFGRRDHGHHF